MLVLYRRASQSILIGNEIEIRVLKVVNGNIRLGINAPDEVKILRDELLTRDKNTNKQLNER